MKEAPPNIREAAEKYTALGWIIHPIKPAENGNKHTGKAPYEGHWQTRDKPRTEAEIDKFWSKEENNIGLLCGRKSGVTVIDIDDDNLVSALVSDLDTSEWVMSKRANGGGRGHIYFKYVPDLRSQKHHQLGIEVLSDGNNCVLPPSLHYSGARYAWKEGGPGPEQLPDMPQKFKQRLLDLFELEKDLKTLLGKCRPCFRKFMEHPSKEKAHGGDGRLFIVAFATELAAAAELLQFERKDRDAAIHLAAKLIYREDYDRARTTKELSGIDPQRPWKCQTLGENFFELCKCDECNYRKKDAKTTKALERAATAAFKDYLSLAEEMQAKVPIIYDQTGTFWIWTEAGYRRTDETDILIALKNSLGMQGITRKAVRTEILEAIKITGRERQVKPRKASWVQFQDQVVDIQTGETFTANPDYFYTAPIPHKLGDSEETPLIDKLLEDWVGPDLKQQLYEILAYGMLDEYPIHRIFCFIGAGRNGKGQFMKLMRKLLGFENVTSTEMERLVESRFETAKLYQKKAVFIGETNFTAISKTNRLKQLSGSDMVTGEWKRKAPFDFINFAKIIIASNSLPATHDRTDGYYSRWLVIEFSRQFPEGADVIDPIPEKEYENLCRKCLRILKELLQAGGFYKEGSIEDRQKVYEEKSNPVAAFVKKYCTAGPQATIPLWELYDAYDVYQNQNGHRIITKRQFSVQLQELGYDHEKGRIGDFVGVYFVGITLKRRSLTGPQLEFKDPEETDQTTDQAGGAEPDIFKPVPGAVITEQARTEPAGVPDQKIREEVKRYTAGTMHIRDIQLFIDYFFRRYPNVQDRIHTAGRIRVLQANGWWSPKDPDQSADPRVRDLN